MREMNSSFPVYTAPLKKALGSGTTLTFDQLTATSSWKNPRTFPLAYAQSWVIAEYLFYRWSNHQIVGMLKQMKAGKTFEQILIRDMNRTLSQFEQEWIAFARGRVP